MAMKAFGHFGGHKTDGTIIGGGGGIRFSTRGYRNYGWPYSYYRKLTTNYRPYAYSYFGYPFLYGYGSYPSS